ncbi:MAG: ATP-grasp fold amidoligase family protein [Pseudomonadota bacterium]
MADQTTDPRDVLDETKEDLRANIDRINARKRPYWRMKARETFRQIIDENHYGAAEPSPAGTLRAFDLLDEPAFYFNFTRGLNWFASNHGFEASILNPRRFTEKMLVTKFFAPVPMPSPGDKLGLGGFIPASLGTKVRTARCVWSSPFADLPETIDAPPGVYYFKANHGSGYNYKVTLPLVPEEHAKLQAMAERWLGVDYGSRGGEWWYNVVQRKVYLEESFSAPGESADDWKFFVLNGRVSIVQVDLDRATNHVQLIYDRDFNYLPQEFFYRTGNPIAKPANYEDLRDAAEVIGGQFEFARVDFYNTSDGVVLGEITLAPGGARQRIRSPSLDDRMGRDWQSDFFASAG